MTKSNFDMEAALKQLREGKDLTGKDGILTPLIKQLTEAAMQAELDEHLADKELLTVKTARAQSLSKARLAALSSTPHVTEPAPLSHSW